MAYDLYCSAAFIRVLAMQTRSNNGIRNLYNAICETDVFTTGAVAYKYIDFN